MSTTTDASIWPSQSPPAANFGEDLSPAVDLAAYLVKRDEHRG